MLSVGSLFSGIGGLELGLERTGGFRTIWFCEYDAYASAVLRKHWPGVPNLGDITKVQWEKVERPDMLTGGFPCQDISLAGKGKGIREGERSGLWSEFAKAIRILRPRYALIENVPELANRGLDLVLADLAQMRYDAEWFLLSAADVGAWHRRQRIFVFAHSACEQAISDLKESGRPGECGWNSVGGGKEALRQAHGKAHYDQSARRSSVISDSTCQREIPEEQPGQRSGPQPICQDVPDSPDLGRERSGASRNRWDGPEDSGEISDSALSGLQGGRPPWKCLSFAQAIQATARRHRARNQQGIWAAEPGLGRVADGVPNRVDRIKCLGNAVVPQVAETIGRWLIDRRLD